MLAAAHSILGSPGAQIVALVLSGLFSGLLATLIGERRRRALAPAQHREMESNAVKAAVETVEAALAVARSQITQLEARVSSLTEKVGELQGKLELTTADRGRISDELNLTLVERARLENKLTELTRHTPSRRLDDLMKLSSPDAILIVDSEGLITFASEGLFSLLGYVPSRVVGQPIEMLVPLAKRDVHRKERASYTAAPRTRMMGEGMTLGLEALTAAGATLPVEISLHPTGDGRVLALMKHRQPDSSGEPEPSPSGSGSGSGGISPSGLPATRTLRPS